MYVYKNRNYVPRTYTVVPSTASMWIICSFICVSETHDKMQCIIKEIILLYVYMYISSKVKPFFVFLFWSGCALKKNLKSIM